MKVYITAQEVYPVCWLTDDPSLAKEVEVDQKTVERWKRVYAEWDKVQEEMYVAIC